MPPPPEDDRGVGPRRRRRLRNVLIGLASGLVLVALMAAGSAWYLQDRLVGNVDRVDGAFTGLEDRPAASPRGSVTVLLMATDRHSRVPTTGDDAAAPTWLPGRQSSDALMVLHIDADREGVSIVSIPRDSWVPIAGHGAAKVSAAFSMAGPSLAVETVESITGLRIDHLAIVDWSGFRALTDELGGVTVTVPETVRDPLRDKTWEAGEHRLDGAEALLYVRQRFGLPRGDLDRVERQQNVLRALMHQTLASGATRNPVKAYGILDTLTEHLTVDTEWTTGEMRDLVLSLRGLDAAAVVFATAPIGGTGRQDDDPVVYLDRAKGRELWEAVRADRVREWVAANPGSELPASVG